MQIILIIIGLSIKFIAQKNFPIESWWRIIPPTKIKKDGLYKYVRHPIYLGNIIFSFGLFWVLCGLGLSIALTYIYLHLVLDRIDREEQILVIMFGDEYLDYLKKTPMLIPFWRKYGRFK